jgi:hypothetical protein
MVTLGLAGFLAATAIFSPDPSTAAGTGIVAALFVLVPRVMDYFLTLHMGRKGLVPLALRPSSSVEASMLPVFPAPTYLLFAGGALALALAMSAAIPEVMSEARSMQAVVTARAGDVDKAWQQWEEAQQGRVIGLNERARFALALYEAGDLEGGDRMVGELGGQAVEQETADKINAIVDLAKAAHEAHLRGRNALLEGKDADAWPDLDRAVTYYAKVKRPTFPKSRAEAVVSLAGDILAYNEEAEAHDRAEELLSSSERDAPADEVAVARARLWTLRQQPEKARAALGGIKDPSSLPPRWQLLRLEAQAAVASDEAERKAATAEISKLSTDTLSEEDRLRLQRLRAWTEGKADATP